MMRPTVLTAALWLALAAAAHAQRGPDAAAEETPAAVNELQRVQVTATRTERAIVDVPNSVDVIVREQLDDRLIRNIKQLVRYEPGISVTSTNGRFGALGGFRIRGLDANRVLILTDGIPVSDTFNFGSYIDANRDFVDLDTLKRVEIVRGPASSLYGSDALGGVVAYVTKDPSDYLKEGKDAYFGLKFGYESEWEGLFAGATAAFGGERWSGMVAASHRQGKETENQGENRGSGAARTAPNPQRRDGRSLLGKLVYAVDANQRLKLTIDANEDYNRVDALGNLSASILSQRGRDHQTRARVSLEHEVDALDAAFADSLKWQLYRQDSETNQRTLEDRAATAFAPAAQRLMRHNFDQRVYGLQGIFYKDFVAGAAQHALTYGLDASVTDSKEKRDGSSTDLATGAISDVVGQDVFPVRDFPISKTLKIGAYVQDEMKLANGRFSLIPALRVDYYKLDPTLDNIFAEDNPGVAVEGLHKTSVSPKLGGIWRFDDAWSAYLNYARGFRAPPYGDVNVGFTNLASGYTVVANPDLKPETSNGYELGLRYAGPALSASLAGYYNDYKDFIESFVFVGINADGLMVFQSQNVSEARIYGAEFKAGVDFGGLDPRLDGLALRAAVAWSRGDDKTADTPLYSIDPLRGSLGLAYDRNTWGMELAGSFAQKKTRLPPYATQPAPVGYYKPAGYGVVDLLAHWNFAPGAKFNVGVFNIGDRKYTDWADVAGIAETSAVLDRYTRPGRTYSASVSFEW